MPSSVHREVSPGNPRRPNPLIVKESLMPHRTAAVVRAPFGAAPMPEVRSTSGAVARGALMCGTAAVLWGTVGATQAILPAGGASPYWLAVLRLFFAVAVFALLCAAQKLRSSQPLALTRIGRAAPRAIAAGAAIAGFNLLYFEGVKACGVGIGATAIIGSAPIWTGLLTALFFKKRPTAAWSIGVAAAVAGGGLMLTGGSLELSVPLSGLAACLAAGLCYAAYTCISKGLVADVPPLAATAMTFAAALVFATPAAWALSGAPVLTTADIAAGLWLGVVATGAAYLLFATGLTRISAGTGVALTLLEPVTAFVLSVAAAGEPFTAAKGIGLLCILLGLVFVLRAEKR